MGNLLRLLARDKSNDEDMDVYLDFENAQPTSTEREVYHLMEVLLEEAGQVLLSIQTYKGAGNEIRDAIGNPNDDESQLRAWRQVIPLVKRLKRFYNFSQQLAQSVPEVLKVLCSSSMSPRQHLETQQAIVKQFSEILDFVLKFDDHKMNNPSIQNDFSYYRRVKSRPRPPLNDPQYEGIDDAEVSSVMANQMSLFYAQATPMLKTVSDAVTHFVTNNKDLPIENVTETLSTIAKVCQRMIENPDLCSRFQRKDTALFVLRVMVGVIILYDHIHPDGAFIRSSKIDVKGSIHVLKEQPPQNVEGLLNALRYTTKHLNDVTTPKSTKSLLAC